MCRSIEWLEKEDTEDTDLEKSAGAVWQVVYPSVAFGGKQMTAWQQQQLGRFNRIYSFKHQLVALAYRNKNESK